jgi:hypothetical protein
MTDVRLTSPRVQVIRDGQDPAEYQTTNADLVLWDRTRAKHKWPTFQEAPFLWLTFLSWAAARRTGDIDGDMTYEKWEAETLNVTALTDEDSAVDPTRPGPDPD